MLHTRQELDAMTEDRSLIYRQWASQLRRIESHLGVPGQVVAIETGIISTREERESDIGTVFHRRILQRFTTSHRTRCSPIVGIEGRKTLAAITTFADTEYIETVGIHLTFYQVLANQLLESILLGEMPPAIIFTLVRNLRNEIDGRRILEAQTEFDTIRPLMVLRSRSVNIQEERKLTIGSYSLLTIIIRHHRIWFQTLRQIPGAVFCQCQIFWFYELFFLQVLVGIAPGCPYHLLVVGNILAVDSSLELGVKRCVFREFRLTVFLQCFLLCFERLQEIGIHLFLQSL